MYSDTSYSNILCISRKLPGKIPCIDFTIPSDSYTGMLYMNYFYDCCVQKSYVPLPYQVHLEIFYYFTRENFFL